MSVCSHTVIYGQTESEKPITCEYFKAIFDNMIYENNNLMLVTKSGKRPFTIFVVAPGNRKDSNLKTSGRLVKALNGYFTSKKLDLSRYIVVEAKQRKGFGTLQIYFLDNVQNIVFNNDIFLCP